MHFQQSFISDLNSVKKAYNDDIYPFIAESISEGQRNQWPKIKQADFCKPSPNEQEKQSREFTPLLLSPAFGHPVNEETFVFNCSYRTSQDFWRYEDAKLKQFACQYPYIDELIRLAVFVRMDPIRCMLMILKLSLERYWKKNFPFKVSFNDVYTHFLDDFEHNSSEVLANAISRDEHTKVSMSELAAIFNRHFEKGSFYYYLSLILSRGKSLLQKRISDLSVNVFAERYKEVQIYEESKKTNRIEQNSIVDLFNSVFDIFKLISQHIIEKEGPDSLGPLIEEIEKSKNKLNDYYFSFIQDQQTGLGDSGKFMPNKMKSLRKSFQLSSGMLDEKAIRLVNTIEKYKRLEKLLLNNPYSVLKNEDKK